MTNAVSTQRRTAEELRHLEQKKAELGIPPAIEFWPKAMATKKVDGGDGTMQKDIYLSIDVPLCPGVKKSPTYERHIKLFNGGTASWISPSSSLVSWMFAPLPEACQKVFITFLRSPTVSTLPLDETSEVITLL